MSQDYILIVGAGPVGLTAAHCIANHDIPVRIVDLNDGPTSLSKALVVWRRTLQVLDSSIQFEQFLSRGHEAKRARFMSFKKTIKTIPLFDGEHLFPAGVFIPQSETEQLLISALAKQGCAVEWQTKLTGLTSESDGVTCQLETPQGSETIRCSWLIDCEGAHSVARHQLNLDFPGEAIPRRWLLGDVQVDSKTDSNETVIVNSPAGMVALFPVGQSRWRIIADGGPASIEQPRRDPSQEELQSILDDQTSLGWQITRSFWRSEFRVSERQVENYVHGRVVLAGDAAHVHSPAGGQGMNTGIQDATNLAWKIALIQKGGAGPSLIETYQEERHPIGKAVLQATGRMLKAAMLTNPLAVHFRNLAMHVGMSLSFIRQHLTDFLTEDSVSLRGSDLCGKGLANAPIQPGDMFPDLAISIAGQTTPATNLLRGSQGACLVFGAVDLTGLPQRFGASGKGFPLSVIKTGPGTDVTHVAELMQALGLKQAGLALVRPDGVVAAIGTDIRVIIDYMTQLESFT